ncbi:cyclodeaminase/cyclohydrolase family protein [Natronorarus salvus]|uniref:cyclodeaminase/cyclohydrolase family protein n=1 Tax=Natronorarus salvus TaxID=3117733 RepID=UPI002F265DE3
MTFADRSVGGFLDEVASPAVTPSAGAVAAVTAASGIALCEMVCIHTIRKGGDTDVEDELREIRDDLRIARRRLLVLADADAEAVDGLRTALDDRNGEGDVDAVEAASRRVVEVPLETAEVCGEVLRLAAVAIGEGTDSTVEDGATGVFLTHAALRSSARLVRANVEEGEDPEFVDEVETRLRRVEEGATEALDRALSNVE